MPHKSDQPATALDEGHCPLCQQANGCAIAADREAAACWCQHQSIEPSAIAAARQLGAAKRCICQRCAEQARQLSREIQ